jgi:uncharacterized protein (DUF1778 family)
MARSVVEESSRIDFRIKPEDKATLNRAADLMGIGLTAFIRQQALVAAQEVIDQRSRLILSERDALKLLDILDNPPEPSPLLREAARRLPKDI